MTVQSIIQGDTTELRTICQEVTEFDDQLITLLEDLKDTLSAYRGLGLSAPQIHVMKRVFVIDLGHGVKEFINPVLVDQSEEMEGYESCLSFPYHTLNIKRPYTIRLRAQDRTGQYQEIEATDILARVICHEMDHLNGILFMDYLSEEQLFTQLLSDACIEDDEIKSVEEVANRPRTIMQRAEQEELGFIVDMVSELSWKLTLALEMLQDYKGIFADTLHWNQLLQINDELEQVIYTLERQIK